MEILLGSSRFRWNQCSCFQIFEQLYSWFNRSMFRNWHASVGQSYLVFVRHSSTICFWGRSCSSSSELVWSQKTTWSLPPMFHSFASSGTQTPACHFARRSNEWYLRQHSFNYYAKHKSLDWLGDRQFEIGRWWRYSTFQYGNFLQH